MLQIAASSAPSTSRTAVANATAAKDLFSITPSYLLPRHDVFPSLDTALQVTLGFREAPRRSKITIVYTALDDGESRTPAENTQLCACAAAIIRDMLLMHRGYEIRENHGNFLLAFERPVDALTFCTAVQHTFLQVRNSITVPYSHTFPAFAPRELNFNTMPMSSPLASECFCLACIYSFT
jgi:hypothetical protein